MATGYEGFTFAELERKAYQEGNQLALEIVERTLTAKGASLLIRGEKERSQGTKYVKTQRELLNGC